MACISLPILFFSCRNTPAERHIAEDFFQKEKADTTVVKWFEYPGYQFYLKKTQFGLLEEDRFFCTLHFNKTDKSQFLFETKEHFEENVPVKVFDDYYLWPHWTGGNGTYCRSEIVFKMNFHGHGPSLLKSDKTISKR